MLGYKGWLFACIRESLAEVFHPVKIMTEPSPKATCLMFSPFSDVILAVYESISAMQIKLFFLNKNHIFSLMILSHITSMSFFSLSKMFIGHPKYHIADAVPAVAVSEHAAP